MKSSTLLRILAAWALAACLAAAQLQSYYAAGFNLPIPPSGSGGSPGGCSTGSPNLTEVTISIPNAFVLTHVRVQVTMNHTFVGDLTLTLRHCGTSVVLYDRSPNSSSDLSGWYAFDDQAALPFATYVSTPGVVPNDNYLPVNPLAPFTGMSAGGDWTLTICDQASSDIGNITSLALTLDGAQTYGGTVSPALVIPDGNGGCFAPVSRAINVSGSGVVDAISVTLGLNHPYVRDLDVTISHDGVAVQLVAGATVAPNVAAQGLYTFQDSTGFTPSFASASNATPSGSAIAPGTYGPATPLSAFLGHSRQGVWLITICDTQATDVGSLYSASIQLSASAYDLVLTQPNGAGSLVFNNKGGLQGNTFVNLATVVPGSYPNGWLNGLDISIQDILLEVSIGAPIIGTLGPCGAATTWINGPIPSALPIQFVSFELDSSGSPVSSKRAFQYVTQ